MTVHEQYVYNLKLEGPSQNPSGVTFTGLPNTYRGYFPRMYFKRFTQNPLTVTVEVPENCSIYGFHDFRGKTVILRKITTPR
jgi:hypothetical protein